MAAMSWPGGHACQRFAQAGHPRRCHRWDYAEPARMCTGRRHHSRRCPPEVTNWCHGRRYPDLLIRLFSFGFRPTSRRSVARADIPRPPTTRSTPPEIGDDAAPARYPAAGSQGVQKSIVQRRRVSHRRRGRLDLPRPPGRDIRQPSHSVPSIASTTDRPGGQSIPQTT